MSDADPSWRRLGLEPTDDARAIRRAYAQRLKATDVDADPAAFVELRAALERALVLAARRARKPEPALALVETPVQQAPREPDIASSSPEVELEPAPEPRSRPEQVRPRSPPAPPAWLERRSVHVAPPQLDRRVLDWLGGLLGGDSPLPEAQAEIAALTAELLADPALNHIAHSMEVEAWLADVIARSPPRSDVMIDPVVAHFRWREQAGGWRRSPAVEAVLHRQVDLSYRAEVARRRHPKNRAYRELTAPPRKRVRLITGSLRREVAGLLQVARSEHPTLMHDFNADSLAQWQARLERGTAPQRAWSTLARRLPGGEPVWNARSKRPLHPINYVLMAALPLRALILLRQGLSARARLAGLAWVVVGVLLWTCTGPLLRALPAPSAPAPTFAGQPTQTCPPFDPKAGASLDCLRQAASQGNATAELRLGLAYGSGNGADGDGANLAEAAKWYRLAADAGQPQAMFMLGRLYQGGQVFPKDSTRAADLYRRAAEGGWPAAASALGALYQTGDGVEKDPREAVRLFKAAAGKNDRGGLFGLGVAYLKGWGVPRSGPDAARAFKAAADLGAPEAMVNLAVQYQTGDGVPKDQGRAITLLRDAAQKGQSAAMFDLGRAYQLGVGVKPDRTLALQWYRAAADAGSDLAAIQLSRLDRERWGDATAPPSPRPGAGPPRPAGRCRVRAW